MESGTRLGPYEIHEQIGAGGMGEVYSATDTRLDRIVAIKVLPEHLASDPQRRERFEREAKAVSSLNHPHICSLYDIGEQDGTHFLVMEYVEGETLQHRLEKGRLSLGKALEYAIQIADALDKAHRQGVVHRDLKPGNIMVAKTGVKLLDFGLAKLKGDAGAVSSPMSELPTQDGSKPLTEKGTILGTLQYMAPEQLEGKDSDDRTDIFAFGAVVYEMVTGKKAFEGQSQASLIAAILDREPPPVSSGLPASPPPLDRIVKTCLEKDPADRWQSSRDVLRELQWTVADREQQSATRLLTPPPMTRRRWLALGGVAAGVLTLSIWLPNWGGEETTSTGPPVIVLMDSTHPLRIYDAATREEGGTNADDLTNILRDLPVLLVKENTSPSWNREEEVLLQNPAIIVAHASSFWDATPDDDPELGQITDPLALGACRE